MILQLEEGEHDCPISHQLVRSFSKSFEMPEPLVGQNLFSGYKSLLLQQEGVSICCHCNKFFYLFYQQGCLSMPHKRWSFCLWSGVKVSSGAIEINKHRSLALFPLVLLSNEEPNPNCWLFRHSSIKYVSLL